MANKSNLQTLKGFRDFIGNESKKRQWLVKNIYEVFNTFGFEPLETPALEYESLLLGKYGKEADKLIYSFKDKGNRRVALRYDQTVPTARIISQYRNDIIFPYRRCQIQPVWRADKPQKGRYREFIQCDADIIGVSSPLADAEIIALFTAIYQKVGIDSLKIQINDRKTLIDVILSCGVDKKNLLSVIQTLDKLSKLTEDEVLSELSQKEIPPEALKNILNTLKKSRIPENIKLIINYAVKMGVPNGMLEYSPYLARGLDYYTGIIFEGIIPEYTVGSVGGGGRYDNLIKDLVNIDMPACGFGLGFDRTLEAAKLLGKIPKSSSSIKVLVTIFSPGLLDDSMRIATKLRNKDIETELYINAEKNFDKQLKYADKKGIPYVIIIGPKEVKDNVVMFKNMKTRVQETITIDQVINRLS